MIRTLRYSSAAAAAILAVAAVSCGREELIPEAIGPAEAGKVETPEEWHDKTRVLPYPKMSNELYVNPSPLIVPENADKGRWLQFALSRDSGFPETGTMLSDTLSWNFFNPHKALESGTWYWKYRNSGIRHLVLEIQEYSGRWCRRCLERGYPVRGRCFRSSVRDSGF